MADRLLLPLSQLNKPLPPPVWLLKLKLAPCSSLASLATARLNDTT